MRKTILYFVTMSVSFLNATSNFHELYKSSKSDELLLKNLSTIHHILDRHQRPYTLIQKTLTKNYDPVFRNEISYLKSLHKILRTSNFKGLSSLCKNHIKASKNQTYVSRYQSKYAFKACLVQSNLLQSKKNTSSQTYGFYKTLYSSIDRLNLTSFFLHHLRVTDLKKSAMNEITQAFYKNPTIPQVIKYLTFSQSVQNFVHQNHHLFSSSHGDVHKSELKRQTKVIFDYVKSEDLKKSHLKYLIENYFNYIQKTYTIIPRKKLKDTLLYIHGILERRNLHYTYQYFTDFFHQKFPKDEEVAFRSMWSWINKDDYSKAIQVFNQFKINSNKIKTFPLRFWLAKSLTHINESEKAKELYYSIISEDQVSYYTYLSLLELKDQNEKQVNKYFEFILNKKSEDVVYFPKNKQNKESLKKIFITSKFNHSHLTNLYIKDFLNQFPNKKDKSFWSKYISQALTESKNDLMNFRFHYMALKKNYLSLSKKTLESIFPLRFKDIVLKESEKISPILTFSLIRQESGFNHKAKSHAGARGLMQLMPQTANRLANKRLSESSLYNPNLNIRLGTKLLEQHLDEYDNNLVFTLSAYNAGRTRVKRWKNEYFKKSSLIHDIENIPFKETRKYVKLIFRNIFFYNILLNNDSKNRALDETYKITLDSSY